MACLCISTPFFLQIRSFRPRDRLVPERSQQKPQEVIYSNSMGSERSRLVDGAELLGRDVSSLGAMSGGRIVLFLRSLVWCQIVTSLGLASGPYFNTIVACEPQTGQITATTPTLSEGSDVPSRRRMECTSIWSGESVDWHEPQRMRPPSIACASALNPPSA